MSLSVVVDTNIVFKDSELDGEVFSTLARLAGKGGVNVFFPPVVVEELIGQFARRSHEGMKKVLQGCRDLKKVGVEGLPERATLEASRAEAVAAYGKRLRQRIASVPASVLSYPSVGHALLAERAVQRRRPFREGKGYCDTLIWFNVLDLAERQVDGQVVLWSDNYKDFGVEQGNSQLHSHLKDDLRLKGLEESRVSLVGTSDALLKMVVVPDGDELAVLKVRFEAEDADDEVGQWQRLVRESIERDFVLGELLGLRGMGGIRLHNRGIQSVKVQGVEVTWFDRSRGELRLGGYAGVVGVVEADAVEYDAEFGDDNRAGLYHFSSRVEFQVAKGLVTTSVGPLDVVGSVL